MTDIKTKDAVEIQHLEARALRVITVLERVAAATQPITASQLATRLNIPKATLARLLETLLTNNYLLILPGEHGYVLGPRSTQLALATLGNNGFRRTCRAILRSLVQSIGETCNLTVLEGDRVIYIDRVETQEPLRLHIEPGARLPLHCTAGGKLLLAHMSRLERTEILNQLPLPRMTPRTLTDRKALDEELDKLAQQGIGLDNEEFVRGMVGIAVPVLSETGKVAAALVCHSATARASLTDLMEFLPQMKDAARKLRGLFENF